MNIQSMSKRDASKHRPTKPTILISIQDGEKQELPFKQRTNHITRSRYVDTLFLYFDDVDPEAIPGKPTMSFAFSDSDAQKIMLLKFYQFQMMKGLFTLQVGQTT